MHGLYILKLYVPNLYVHGLYILNAKSMVKYILKGSQKMVQFLTQVEESRFKMI